jgi:serine/threonine protein kinase
MAMSFSHKTSELDASSIIPFNVLLMKTVLQNEPTSLFSTTKLRELLEKSSGSPAVAPLAMNIPFRILKIQGNADKPDKYYMIKKGFMLGRGAEGKVKLLVDLDSNEEFALKVIEDNEYIARKQFKIMEKIGEAQAIILRKSLPDHDFKDNRIRKQYIVMRLAKGDNLLTLLTNHVNKKIAISTQEWLEICLEILRAVNDLHQKKGVLHCDIKLENILYDTQTKKLTLIDYGCALEYKENTPVVSHESIGTGDYKAPELNTDEDENGAMILPSYSEKSDIYALGQLIKEILGFEQFIGEDVGMYISNESTYEELKSSTQSIKPLVDAMRESNPTDRPLINSIYQRLNTIYTDIKNSQNSFAEMNSVLSITAASPASSVSPSASSTEPASDSSNSSPSSVGLQNYYSSPDSTSTEGSPLSGGQAYGFSSNSDLQKKTLFRKKEEPDAAAASSSATTPRAHKKRKLL